MLLVDETLTFQIEVYHAQDTGVFVIYPSAPPTAAERDVFTFRRPNWIDVRNMNSASVLVDAVSGKAIIDPYKYMDLKVKTLLTDWTISKGEEKVPISPDNVNRLQPELIQYLFQRLEERLAPTAPEVIPPTTEG